MNTDKILIVGAGAGGLITGYHLSLSGAQVTFYVRPKRIAELQPPLQLYSYDELAVKSYSNFSLTSDLADLETQGYDYVLLTLDGASVRTVDGVTLLQTLGAAIKNTRTRLISFVLAMDSDEYVLEQTGLESTQLASGSFLFFAHPNPLPQFVKHDSVNLQQLDSSKQAYRHLFGKYGVILGKDKNGIAKGFAAIYNKNGASCCAVVPQTMPKLINSVFAITAGYELVGWPATTQVIQEKEVWALTTKAANEIAALPEHGVIGKVMACVMTPYLWWQAWKFMQRQCLPLDFDGFSEFHHGAKVVEQDTQVLRDALAKGQSLGKEMPNLAELIARVDRHRGAS